jgi:hypothetical protein
VVAFAEQAIRGAAVVRSQRTSQQAQRQIEMSTYRLYKSPEGDIVRVKMGFSWRAFFVGSMSAVIRRTWLLFVVAALYYASEAYFYGVPTPTSRTAGVALAALGFYAVYMLFCGVNGNRWLSDSLRRRGFTLIGEERR